MPLPERIGAVHFTGIGGSGMSGIARLFIDAGHEVSGSDRSANHNTEDLASLGARIAIGHDAVNLGDADTLVYTGALWPDNPEYLAAVERGIPVLHRSQALALADQEPAAHRGRRRARQDHLHRHDHHRADRAGCRPELRERWRHPVARGERAPGHRGALRRRGRRVGRHIPALRHGGRADHQRRRGSPRPLRNAGRVRQCVRGVRHPVRPSSSWYQPTTPERWR